MENDPRSTQTNNIVQSHENQGMNIAPATWPGVIGVITVVFLIIVAYVARYYVSEHSASIKFGTEAMFSFAALLVVIAQAVIYRQQRDAMRQQIEIARVAERGYIGIKDVTIFNLGVGMTPCIEVIFLNGGRTPVWNLHPPATLRLAADPPSDMPEYPSEIGGFMPAGTTRPAKYYFPRDFTSEDVAQVTSGAEKIFLFGKVWFEDCWGERRDFPFRLVLRADDGKFEEYKEKHQWK